MRTSYRYIAIEGNIGAGKTTLAQLLSRRLEARYLPEEFAGNPFLPSFYENRDRYAFPLELSFLEERFRHVREATMKEGVIVSDYLWEKSLVFARVTLAGEELKLFERIYNVMGGQLQVPDVVFYIHRSTDRLLQHISRRGREYEKSIPQDYLAKISAGYRDYFASEKRMPVIWLDNDMGPEPLAQHVQQLLGKQFSNGLHLNP